MKKILLLLFLLSFCSQEKLFPQISPGDLTKAHAHLEGLSNCTKCHVLGEQVYNSKCLDCHTEINNLIKSGRGYHSGSEVKLKDCWSCHSEHHGRNFRIINFNPDGFNHNKTGFELTGSHTKTKCASCHQAKFIADSKLKKRTGTYLGMNQSCISCHIDFHKSTLGNNCSTCHNTEKFRPAPGFNHDKAQFKLTGPHKTIECIKCHFVEEKGGEKFQKFKGISFSSCSSCHKDVHQGRFGPDCQSCHNTNSFHQINQAAFDHNKTNFPLTGKHVSVKCNDCHKGNLTSKPKHEKCTDCHTDYHKGDFVKYGIEDCSSCHNEKGFTPSLFTLERHNKTEFQLTGSHLAVPCAGCHLKNNEWHFRNIKKECIDCHNNVHGKEISSQFMGNNNCTGCHSSKNWFTISFDHNKTSFKLLGKHFDVSCSGCHSGKDDNGLNELLFASLSSGCLACHADHHSKQFSEPDCERCHSFEDWLPKKFDHNKTKFPLEGAHSKIECSRCHKVVNEKEYTYIKYKLENFKCADCHS